MEPLARPPLSIIMDFRLKNPDPRYPRAQLVEPTERGYLYVAAAVHANKGPVVLPSVKRKKLLSRLKELAADLERTRGVVKATVFRAIVRPPTQRMSSYLQQREPGFHGANYDVLVLIETISPAAAHEIQASPAYGTLLSALQNHATGISTIAARNAKRIGDVDTTRKGLFLFNHFVADDQQVMLQLWDYLAGWYMVETHLDNSVALTPVEGEQSDYAIINWARWEVSPLRHFWNQLSKKSFWRYVTANLEANHAGSMPIYCRLA